MSYRREYFPTNDGVLSRQQIENLGPRLCALRAHSVARGWGKYDQGFERTNSGFLCRTQSSRFVLVLVVQYLAAGGKRSKLVWCRSRCSGWRSKEAVVARGNRSSFVNCTGCVIETYADPQIRCQGWRFVPSFVAIRRGPESAKTAQCASTQQNERPPHERSGQTQERE
jgi:hypothetical protein